MFGVFRNYFGIASHRLPGLPPNDEGDRERLVCHLANRDAHDPSPWFACERGLYVRPPVKGVLPGELSVIFRIFTLDHRLMWFYRFC